MTEFPLSIETTEKGVMAQPAENVNLPPTVGNAVNPMRGHSADDEYLTVDQADIELRVLARMTDSERAAVERGERKLSFIDIYGYTDPPQE